MLAYGQEGKNTMKNTMKKTTTKAERLAKLTEKYGFSRPDWLNNLDCFKFNKELKQEVIDCFQYELDTVENSLALKSAKEAVKKAKEGIINDCHVIDSTAYAYFYEGEVEYIGSGAEVEGVESAIKFKFKEHDNVTYVNILEHAMQACKYDLEADIAVNNQAYYSLESFRRNLDDRVRRATEEPTKNVNALQESRKKLGAHLQELLKYNHFSYLEAMYGTEADCLPEGFKSHMNSITEGFRLQRMNVRVITGGRSNVRAMNSREKYRLVGAELLTAYMFSGMLNFSKDFTVGDNLKASCNNEVNKLVVKVQELKQALKAEEHALKQAEDTLKDLLLKD